MSTHHNRKHGKDDPRLLERRGLRQAKKKGRYVWTFRMPDNTKIPDYDVWEKTLGTDLDEACEIYDALFRRYVTGADAERKVELANISEDLEISAYSADEPYSLIEWLTFWSNITRISKLPAQRGTQKGKNLKPGIARDYQSYIEGLRVLALQYKTKFDCDINCINDDYNAVVGRFRSLVHTAYKESPKQYDRAKIALNKCFNEDILGGRVVHNLAQMLEKINRDKVRPTEKMDMAVFQEYRTWMAHHEHNKGEHDGEWRARMLDFLAYTGIPPQDVFVTLTKDGSKTTGLLVSDINLEEGYVAWRRNKNERPVRINFNAAMRKCVKWILAWREKQSPKTDNLFVMPAYCVRDAGEPLKYPTVRKWMAAAAEDLGYVERREERRYIKKLCRFEVKKRAYALHTLYSIRHMKITMEKDAHGEAVLLGHDEAANRMYDDDLKDRVQSHKNSITIPETGKVVALR